MPSETMGGGVEKQEFHKEKHDQLVKGLYDGVRQRLFTLTARQKETIDHRHITIMPLKEMAKAIIDANAQEGDMSAGLWNGELEFEGFNVTDRGVTNVDFTKEGHETLVARRAKVMDGLFRKLGLENGYAELKEEEREVFLDANFVAFLSELAHTLSNRVNTLEAELKVCKGGK